MNAAPEIAPAGYTFVLAQPVKVGGRMLFHTMPVCGWFDRLADASRVAARFQADSGVTPILIQLPAAQEEA